MERQKKTLGIAVTSLIFGCFYWLPFLGMFCSLIALILGIIALSKISNNKDTLRGRGLAIVGIALGAVVLLLRAGMFITFYISSLLPEGGFGDKFYDAISFFAWHPERALAVAVVFFVLFFLSRKLERQGWTVRSKAIRVPAIAWTIIGFLEWTTIIQKANIRIDLSFTPLFMAGITVFYSIWWALSLFRGAPRNKPEAKTT